MRKKYRFLLLGLMLALFCMWQVPIQVSQATDYGNNGWAPTDGVYNTTSGAPNGVPVYQATGITPTVTATYTPAATDTTSKAYDPWRGGTIHIHYADTVKADTSDWATLIATGIWSGWGFAAYINLAPQVTSSEILAGLTTSPSLVVAGTKVDLTTGSLVAVDDHTLRLTMRSSNVSKGSFSTILSILTSLNSSGASTDKIPITYDIDVDVAKMAAAGVSDDTSPNKILTTGMLQPVASPHTTPLSVDFYGKDRVKEGGKKGGILGLSIVGTDILYAQPDSTGSYASNRASTSYTSWSDYLSPWDTQSTANTNQDSQEVVDGSAANLPGSVNQRTVTIGSNEDFDPARFIRVVNFFTKTNVTSGATVHYTEKDNTSLDEAGVKAAGLAAGASKTILYYGTAADGTKLSPVTLTIKRAAVAIPSVTTDAISQNMTLNSSWGKSIIATAGNTIATYHTFTLGDIATGGSLTNPTITLALPAHATYVPGSLKINGTAITGTPTAAGLTVSLNDYNLGLAAKGDQLAVQYQYTLDADTPTGTLTTPAATFSSQFTFPDTPNLPLVKATSPTTAINVAAVGLTLSAPATIDFGQHYYKDLPNTFTSTDTPAVSVQDTLGTTTPWTLTAQTSATAALPGQLSINGKTLSTTATTLYEGDGVTKGTIDVTKAAGLQPFKLAMTRTDLMQATGTNGSYQGNIIWTLSAGPTE